MDKIYSRISKTYFRSKVNHAFVNIAIVSVQVMSLATGFHFTSNVSILMVIPSYLPSPFQLRS